MPSRVALATAGVVFLLAVSGAARAPSEAWAASSACGGPTSGLMSCWPADGNATDVVGGNNGTPVGPVGYGPGYGGGQAFQLDGTSSYIDIGDPASLKPTHGLTLDAWVDPDHVSGDLQAIVSKWAGNNTTDSYAMYLVGSGWPCASGAALLGSIGVHGSDQCGIGGGTVPPNEWSNVGITYDATNGNLTIYVNGSAVASGQVPGGINESDVPVQIGHQASGGERFFGGLIDDVSIYDRALSAGEMQSFAAGVTPPPTSCAASGMSDFSTVSGVPLPGVAGERTAGSLTGDLVLAKFRSTAPVSSLSATVDWQDGTSPEPAAIRASGDPTAPCAVVASHRYTDVGHYVVTATVSSKGAEQSAFDAVSVHPAVTTPPPAVGVLASHLGTIGGSGYFYPPQCTGTVVDLDHSTAATAEGRRLLDSIRKSDVWSVVARSALVVTARHCIPVDGNGFADSGYGFAPGHLGVSPLYLEDFDSGTVSTTASSYGGSPFGGQPVGPSPYGVWRGGIPIMAGGSNPDDDWALLPMTGPAPAQAHGSTLQAQVGGGVPIHFEGEHAAWAGDQRQWRLWGYDVRWVDGPPVPPASLSSGQAGALMAGLSDETQPGSGAPGCGPPANPNVAPYPECSTAYPLAPDANGAHACDAPTRWAPGAVPSAALQGPENDALHITIGPCHLGVFASGGPYITGGELWAVNSGSFNDNGGCCTNVGTFLSLNVLRVLAAEAQRPVVQSVRLAPARFRATAAKRRTGAALRYRLSQTARVRIQVRRVAVGRRVGRRCRPVTGRTGRRRRCSRLVPAGTLRFVAVAGRHVVRFTGRIGRRRLRPGRYVMTVRPTNALGRTGRSRTLRFTIVR